MKPNHNPINFEFETYVHDSSTWYSRVTFFWLVPLLRLGYNTPLELENLGQLPAREKSSVQYEKFRALYNAKKSENKPVSLWRCYLEGYWGSFVLGGILKLCGDCVGVVAPVGISVVVQYVQDPPVKYSRIDAVTVSEFLSNGYVMAVIVFISSIAQGSFSQASTHILNVEGIRLKTALQVMVYTKMLRLSSDEKSSVINLVSDDTNNIMSCFSIGNYVWAIPLKITILMCLLYSSLGVSAVIGAGITIAVITPLLFYIGKQMSANSKHISEWCDERLRQTNEVLQGIKLIKICAWEDKFIEKIETTRDIEQKYLNKDSIYWGIMTLLTHISSIIVTLVTLCIFAVLQDTQLTASNIFSALALFNQLTVPLFIFPITIPIIISAKISTKRIEDFLNSPEVESVKYTDVENIEDENENKDAELKKQNSVFGLRNISEYEDDEDDGYNAKTQSAMMRDLYLSINEAKFSWVPTDTTNVLHVDSLTIKKGCLTMIIGRIGSGKTSLISGIIGEMPCVSGQVLWNRTSSIALVPQKPWLMNTTIRENIVFGRLYHRRRFDKTIKTCCLQPDLDILPEKDLTVIGDQGINLSGGQKQRIAIARALYSKANVLILDDPFSALDGRVASHIFEQGFLNFVKRGGAVVLATHATQLISKAHYIIYMENSKIQHKGNLCEIDSSLISKWKEAANLSHVDVIEKTARERQMLIKLVSRMGSQKRGDDLWSTGQSQQSFRPFRRRLSTYSGSRYFTHDLPLPTEECEDEQSDWEGGELRLRRKSTFTALNMLHKPVNRASSLQNSPQERYRFNSITHGKADNVESGNLLRQLLSMNAQRHLDRASSMNEKIILKRLLSSSSVKSNVFQEEKLLVHRLHSTASETSDEEEIVSWNLTSSNENREYGEIPLKAYWTYFSECGLFWLSIYIVSTVSWQVLRIMTDFWLTKWSEDKHANEQVFYYLFVYALFSFGSICLSMVSNCTGQTAGARARYQLHNSMLENLLKCPMKFYETTPLGQIINRFSNDLSIIDKKIATSIQRLIQFFLMCVSAFIVNSIVTPWFLVFAAPICVVYYVIQKFYTCSLRELQRLDSIARAPILSHYSETDTGLETIRAFKQQETFTNVFFHKLDCHTNVFYIINAGNRWLGIALDYLGAVVVFIAILVSLVSSTVFPHLVTPPLIGLAINYTLLLPIYLNWIVKFLSDIEMYMGAVERISDCSKLPIEDYNSEAEVPKNWPLRADIRLEKASVQYDSSQQPVFTNLNLTIPHGQKIGICGQTGSGKSSLAMCLFRMAPLQEGQVFIGDRNISTIPLRRLRSCLSAIPQDVIMFSGTIRDNLDLRKEFTDEEIWHCLELAQLKKTVSEYAGELYGQVKEGGENFSAGERQLFCLARGILHNTTCLVMDEATSSLDADTEKTLINAARSAFEKKTVIIVAHRLQSLLDCERIIVLESGKIVEDGSPCQLLAKPGGVLASMLRATQSTK
uniref:ATP-binding cassette sub-family C member 8 n=7 Tax=Cacopsylla melanoneura TaxID=428564 RepID=A0A8D9AUF0_9HEMI